MSLDKKMQILIVGLGLMGGSYAKALSRRGYCVSALTKDDSSINYALKNSISILSAIFTPPKLTRKQPPSIREPP